MLRITFLLSLLFTAPSFLIAQDDRWTITGEVKDANNTPLPAASVRLMRKGTGTLTNQTGKFILKGNTSAISDSLEVSYLGFESIHLAIASLDRTRPITILLKPLPAALQAVIVKPLNPVELLEQARQRIPDNYFTTPLVTRGFYRIDTKKGQEHIMLSEAVFDIYNFGYTSPKTNQFQLQKMRSIQDEKASHGIDLGLKPKGLYDFDIIKQIASSDLLSKNGIKKHQFTLRGVINYQGREVYKILFDQKEGIKESLFKGQLYLDAESLAFVAIQMARSPRGMAWCKYGDAGTRALLKILGMNIDIRKETFDIIYRPHGGKWVLSSVRNDNTFQFKSNRQFYDFPADIRVDYIITDIDTLPGNAFVSKEMLSNNKFIEGQQSDNDTTFWKDHTILLADYNAEDIAKTIQARNASFDLKSKMEEKLRKIRGDAATRIDSICTYYHSMGSFNGTALIKYKEKIILVKGYGMADKEKAVAASDTTQYRIGSLSKSFTGQLILQLVQENKLRLEDTIGRFFPSHVHAAITIAQLLTHTSGIPSYTKNDDHTAALMSRPYSMQEMTTAFCSDQPEFTPGTQFSYSNSGYLLLAAIVEKASGQSFSQALQERLFTPLGMTRSGLGLPALNSTGYWMGTKEPVYPIANMAGAGGIAATVQDLLKWDEAMYKSTILPDSLLAASFTPRVDYTDWDAGYGYGWMIDKKMFRKSAKHKIIYHPGTDFGYYAMFVRQPDQQNLIILLSNAGDFPRFDMTDLILKELE